MRLTTIDQHKVSQNLGQFFELIQSIFDIGNLLQVFIFLCSQESNLNIGWPVDIVFLDCDTRPPHVVFCYFIYSFTDVELLVQI